MYAAFCFQKSICKRSIKLESAGFYSCSITPYPIKFSYFPALTFTIHTVHACQHLGPILAFCSTRTGINLQHCRQFVLRLIQRTFELCIFNLPESFFIVFFRLFLRCVTCLPEIKQHNKIFHGSFCLLVKFYPVFILLNVFENFCCPLVIIPETGTQRKLLFLSNFISFVFNVKETSLGQPHGPSFPVFFLLS